MSLAEFAEGSKSGSGSGPQQSQRFGKYELIRRLAAGGMAEIFLAKETGLSGFERLLVIKRIPVEYAAHVVAQAAAGLDYAHRKGDINGAALGLVHRDVSPQNMLVTYDGHVKVVDFGVAKAANKMAQTRPGVLKGKYSYMSP